MAISKIKTKDIVLIWICPECKNQYAQPLPDIVQSGTAVCPDCDCDCDLSDDLWTGEENG